MRRGPPFLGLRDDDSGYAAKESVRPRVDRTKQGTHAPLGTIAVEMKQGIHNKRTSPRHWAWWTVLPVFLLLAATAQAGDLPDPGIDPPAGTGVSRPQGVGTGTARTLEAVKSAGLGPQASLEGVEHAAPPASGEGADPGSRQPAGFPAPADPGTDLEGAGSNEEPGDGTSLEGSDARTIANDARAMIVTQVTETIERASNAVRITALAAIDSLRAQLTGTIGRIDPALASAPEHQSAPEAIHGWVTAPDAGTKEPAGGSKRERGALSPLSGGTRPATESSTHQINTGNRIEHEDPLPSSTSPGPAAGLSATAQILISIGLAAAVCGSVSPAVRRRLSPRAGRLSSALLASSLEQPG